MTYHCDLCREGWPLCLCKGWRVSEITAHGDQHRVFLCWRCYSYRFEPRP